MPLDDVELLDVDVSMPPLLVELVELAPLLVELLDDVDVFTGSVVTRPPPSGVPVPSPEPPVEDVEDVEDVVPPAAVEEPAWATIGSLPSASVTGGWSSPAP